MSVQQTYFYQGEAVSKEVYDYLSTQDRLDANAERRFWRNTASLDELRDRHMPIERLLAFSSDEACDTGNVSEMEDERLMAALERLSVKERELVLLHAVHGYPLTEIAGRLGEKYDTVKKRYLRALGKLKTFIE